MFYSPELLSLRKKGKLSRCWLAGTLSDRLFKKTINNKTVLSIDIQVTWYAIFLGSLAQVAQRQRIFIWYTKSNEILKFINGRSNKKSSRLSLYISAHLLYGTVKLFRIQTTSFQDSIFRVKANLNPVHVVPKKRTGTDEITLHDEPMIEAPVVEFGDLQREDKHLLLEEHIQTIGNLHYEDPLNFGALTDEEMGVMFFNDIEIRLCASPDHHGRTIDESREQHRSPGTTEVHNLGLSDALPVVEETTNAEITAESLRISRKRLSTTTNLDMPAKKQRLQLRQGIDVTAEEIPEEIPAEVQQHDRFTEIPPDVEIQPPDTFVELPAHETVPQIDESTRLPPESPAVPAPPAQEHTVNITEPVDSNLHLESIELETLGMPRPLKVRRGRMIRQIDEINRLPDAQTGKLLVANPSVHAIRCVPPVTDRKRGMLAAALLLNPTTNRRCSRGADFASWAQELFPNFAIRTMGPFVAENDGSMSAEAIRLADSGMQSASVKISRRHQETIGLEASTRNKTDEEPILMDSDEMALPLVPEVPENVPEPLMDIALANITDEPMLENISEHHVDLPPEIELPPIPQNTLEQTSVTATVSIAKLPQSEVRESVTTDVKSTSDSNTGDIDAFLPPKLRKKSVEKKTSHEKSSTSEAIVDICDSPTSVRSEQSIHSTWNKPELMAYLKILWHDNRIVPLDDLLPPDKTSKVDAAVCFTLLLGLSKDGKVTLDQKEPYGTIYISKKVASRRGMDSDEA